MKWRSRLCKSPKSFPCQKAFSGTPTRHPCISNETRMCSHQSLCLRPLCCSLWCFLSPFSLKVCTLKPRFREKKKFQCASVLYRFNLCMNGVCAKLCPILCDPMDFSPPGSSVPGLSQARYWSGLLVPPPGDWTPVSWVSCIDRQVLYRWATWVTNLKLLTLCHRNKRWTCLDLKFCFCLCTFVSRYQTFLCPQWWGLPLFKGKSCHVTFLALSFPNWGRARIQTFAGGCGGEGLRVMHRVLPFLWC